MVPVVINLRLTLRWCQALRSKGEPPDLGRRGPFGIRSESWLVCVTQRLGKMFGWAS